MSQPRRSPYGSHWLRGLGIGGISLVLTIFVAIPAEHAMRSLPLALVFPIVLFIIGVGVFFDMVGVAAAAAEEPPLHAMAAKRIPGAREALRLVKRADRVTSITNDIVGDIAGTLSGAAGATLVIRLVRSLGWPQDVTTALIIGLITALTAGGKAFIKGVGLSHATEIMHMVGYTMHWMNKLRRWRRPRPKRARRRSQRNA